LNKTYQNNLTELELLYKEHYTLLCLVSFNIVKDRDDAKDVVQDFFVSYWKRINDISLRTSFKSYAVRAVKNLSLQSMEKNHSKNIGLENLKGVAPEDDTDQHSLKTKRLQELLNRLPEKRRNILMSVVVHGHSYAEIAESNGISVNTVKTQMKRAYAFLRREADKDLLYLLAIMGL
jgi:RNA polymerase sigma-70 factor (family 1)